MYFQQMVTNCLALKVRFVYLRWLIELETQSYNLPGNNDRFSEVFEHEREGRRGVGQGVGAVQNDEPVEQLVRVLDVLGDLKYFFKVSY